MATSPSTPSGQKSDLPGLGPLQWGLIALGATLACGMLVLAVVYSGGPTNEPVFTGGPVDGGGSRDAEDLGEEELDINPIESFLPTTGTGATCSEAVGVDLIPGFSARLTINGVPIPTQEMNGFALNGAGEQVNVGGSSLGQFTWGPEVGCPQGEILRPQNNTLEACIYRNSDGPDACRTSVHTFDAL